MERLFAQELPGGTPATLIEITPATARALISKGMAEERQISVGGGPMGGLRIISHMLTLQGHIAYCEWAAEQPDELEED